MLFLAHKSLFWHVCSRRCLRLSDITLLQQQQVGPHTYGGGSGRDISERCASTYLTKLFPSAETHIHKLPCFHKLFRANLQNAKKKTPPQVIIGVNGPSFNHLTKWLTYLRLVITPCRVIFSNKICKEFDMVSIETTKNDFVEVGNKRITSQPCFHACLKLAYQGAILENLVDGKDLLTLGSSWNVIMVSSLFSCHSSKGSLPRLQYGFCTEMLSCSTGNTGVCAAYVYNHFTFRLSSCHFYQHISFVSDRYFIIHPLALT